MKPLPPIRPHRQPPEPSEAQALRLAIVATIAAILKAPDVAEVERLIAERNRMGKRLAHLLKTQPTPDHE